MITTSDALLESVKRACTAPDYQARLEDSDILAMADEVISGVLIPLIINSNAELLVRRDTITVVSGQREYQIPARAIGRTLRNIAYRTSATATPIQLNQVDLQDEATYANGTATTAVAFEGDYYLPLKAPTSGEFLVSYACQPSALCKSTDASLITNIDRVTGVISIATTLSGASTSTPCDFVSGRSGFNLKGLDATPADVSGTNIQFAVADIPTNLAVGDYLCTAGYTPVIPVPRELLSLLTVGVQGQVYQLLGDLEAAQAAQAKFADLYRTIPSILTPRLVGTTKKVGRSPFLNGSNSSITKQHLWRL